MPPMRCQDFTVEHNAVVVGGGHLGNLRKWVVEPFNMDGKYFITLSKADRNLARAMGCDMNKQYPFDGYNLFEHLYKLRDDKVDHLIMQYKFSDDPGADAVGVDCEDAMVRGRGYKRLYTAAGVPRYFTLTHPPFYIGEGLGKRLVPEHDILVTSSMRRKASLAIELTAENLDWLADVASVMWPDIPDAFEDIMGPELPELTAGGSVHWGRQGQNRFLYCRYRSADGEWHRKRQVVKCFFDVILMETMVAHTERRLQMFYSENHHAPPARAARAAGAD